MATIAITGAARGIGLEMARQLSARGDEVIAICRESNDDLAALPLRVIDGIDVTRNDDVQRLARELDGKHLDALINNAGILTSETLDDLDLERIRRQFEVNSIVFLAVSQALLPCLGQGSKLVIITSRMGSIDDNGSGGMYGYRMSKAAANMAAKSLAIDLQPRGIAVGLFHPGLVATRMTGFNGIEPAAAATQLIQRLDALTPETSGVFFHASGETLPW